MRTIIIKPQRMKIASALRAACVDVFGVEWPMPKHGDHDLNREDCRAPEVVVQIGVGEMSVSIEASPRLLSLFCRLAPNAGIGVPLTEAQKQCARRVNGNHFSGKVNWHCGPDAKPDDAWIEAAVRGARVHLEILRDFTPDH